MTGLYFGGMERVAFIARELLKEKYNVEVAALYTKDADYKVDFEIIDLGCPPVQSRFLKAINLVKRVLAVWKMKREIKPDIVISFGPGANFSNAITRGQDRAILGIRSYDWLTDYFVNHSVDKWIYRKADIVASVSKVIAEKAKKVFEIESSKSKVLYNPYDVAFIKQKSLEHVNDLEFSINGPLVLSVGRLVDQKGFNHLIKSFSMLLEKHPNAVLMIIGHGEKESDLRELIQKLDIEENVQMLGGKDNPYKYMRIADMFVVSSVTEGFPNAMVEAMAVGLPIVAVDCKSGPREILSTKDISVRAEDVELEEYGIICPEVSGSTNYDAESIEECDISLSKGISMLLDSKELRQMYSAKSVERAKEFTYEKFKNNLYDMLDDL